VNNPGRQRHLDSVRAENRAGTVVVGAAARRLLEALCESPATHKQIVARHGMATTHVTTVLFRLRHRGVVRSDAIGPMTCRGRRAAIWSVPDPESALRRVVVGARRKRQVGEEEWLPPEAAPPPEPPVPPGSVEVIGGVEFEVRSAAKMSLSRHLGGSSLAGVSGWGGGGRTKSNYGG
jgi:hypothetical protein